jgi:hypothetical protein
MKESEVCWVAVESDPKLLALVIADLEEWAVSNEAGDAAEQIKEAQRARRLVAALTASKRP